MRWQGQWLEGAKLPERPGTRAGVRSTGTQHLPRDGQDLNHTSLGALLRLRRRPPAGLPAKARVRGL